jgi:MFS family permease
MTAGAGEHRVLGENRDFTLLWVGGAISGLGSSATLIVLPLLILVTTGSAANVGLVMSLVMVVSLLVSLPAGAWVDRVDKRRLMLVCDLARAVAQGLLAAAIVTKHTDLVVILLASLATVPFSSLFGIAEDPTVRHVVPTEQLPLALARNQARGSAAALCGPPLGGALFVIDPSLPIAADAATFLVSFCCIALIRTPTPAPTTSEISPSSQRSSLDCDSYGIKRFCESPCCRSPASTLPPTPCSSPQL